MFGKDKRLQAALNAWHLLNTKYQWARLDVTDHCVSLALGIIHSNGFEEVEFARLFYRMEDNGRVSVAAESHHG